MDKLVKESFITRAAGESYAINKKKVPFPFLWKFSPMFLFIFYIYWVVIFSLLTASELQNSDYDFDAVKEENDVQVVGDDGKTGGADHMYMKVNFLLTIYIYRFFS